MMDFPKQMHKQYATSSTEVQMFYLLNKDIIVIQKDFGQMYLYINYK